jgi:predicted ester cyclase
LTTQENIAKVTAGFVAVNNRDIPAFVALLEPDFKLFLIVKPERLMPQGQVSGPEGFAKYLEMLYTAFSDVVFDQQGITANGNMVYQQLVVRGKHTGPLTLPNGITLPATKLKVNLPTEVFHTFNEQGGFVSSTGYANLMDIMKQFKG